MDGPTLQDYLDRARSFALSPREVEDIAEHLRTTDDDRARFKCIMILRRQGSRAHVPLVAPLVHSADNGVADEAMRFLIRDADRADLCRARLLEWLGDEDEFSFKQMNAVQLAGEAYLQLNDKALLREIVRLLDHEEREGTGAAAAGSLIKALTPNYKRMTPHDRHVLLRTADVPFIASVPRLCWVNHPPVGERATGQHGLSYGSIRARLRSRLSSRQIASPT